MEKRERNKLISADFNECYKSSIESFGGVSYMGIYRTLGRKYALSGMQVRRIIRGYRNKKQIQDEH